MLSVGSKQQLETREPYTEDKEDLKDMEFFFDKFSTLTPIYGLPPEKYLRNVCRGGRRKEEGGREGGGRRREEGGREGQGGFEGHGIFLDKFST
jgi:hypothetical protein